MGCQIQKRRLIDAAYRAPGARGLLVKTLFQTGARVSEFVNIQVSDVFFDEQMIHAAFSPRRIQQLVKETADSAGITKQVSPHVLKHSVATTLLEKGMPLEHIQKFLGHVKLDTTQVYAASTTAMIQDSYRQAMTG